MKRERTANTKCRACRSVNHATSPRCLNCGAPLDEQPGPIGGDTAVTQPAAVGWTAEVPPSPDARDGSGTLLMALAILATLVSMVMLVVILNSHGLPAWGAPLFFVVAILPGIFWIWMLVDAVGEGQIGWAFVIFFLGTVGALLYLFIGRHRRARSEMA